jgi:hypothetical protein
MDNKYVLALCLFIQYFIQLPTNRLYAGQGLLNGWNIDATCHYGLVIPEYKNFLYVVEKHTYSSGMSLSKRTTGKNQWEQLYNYPEYGFRLFYSTLGNNVVNGYELALFPYFSLFWFKHNHFNIFNQIGVGLSYVSRIFDPGKNYRNIAVGSHVNIHFNARLGVKYSFNRLFFQTGISFDHFSNANMREPNLGINYVSGFAGMGYRIGNDAELVHNTLEPHKEKHYFEIIYSFGGKHTRAFQEKFFITSSFTAEYKYEPLRMFRIGLGADIFYDSATEKEMSAATREKYKGKYDYRTGVHLSQEVFYNRFSVIIQEGIYMIYTDKVEGNIMYNRGILRYTIAKHILVSIAMKSHLHILDFPEIGIGYRW